MLHQRLWVRPMRSCRMSQCTHCGWIVASAIMYAKLSLNTRVRYPRLKTTTTYAFQWRKMIKRMKFFFGCIFHHSKNSTYRNINCNCKCNKRTLYCKATIGFRKVHTAQPISNIVTDLPCISFVKACGPSLRPGF